MQGLSDIKSDSPFFAASLNRRFREAGIRPSPALISHPEKLLFPSVCKYAAPALSEMSVAPLTGLRAARLH